MKSSELEKRIEALEEKVSTLEVNPDDLRRALKLYSETGTFDPGTSERVKSFVLATQRAVKAINESVVGKEVAE